VARAQYATATTESLGFNWLRQLAVLRAYVWFARRIRRWEQARWGGAPIVEPAPAAQPERAA
jgi:hypothetical protein